MPSETWPLERIFLNAELHKRGSRVPNFEIENSALLALAQKLGESPKAALQELTHQAVRVCGAGSAGISIAETHEGQDVFRWHAVAGQLSAHVNGTLPRHFSPCGAVLDRDEPILMGALSRHYDYVAQLGLEFPEVLLVPFYHDGVAIGTIWAASHSPEKSFDLEDLRVLKSLAQFTSGITQSYFDAIHLEKSESLLKQADSSLVKALNQVQQERENYRRLFENTAEFVCVLAGSKHRFEYVNEAHKAILGFDATGMTVAEAQPEADGLIGILNGVFQTGKPAAFREAAVKVGERTRYFNFIYTPRRDHSQKIDGVMVMGSEVTDQVLTKQGFQLQRDALELALNGSAMTDVFSVLVRMVEDQVGNGLIASLMLADKDGKRLYHGAAPNLPTAYNEAISGVPVGEGVGSCGTAAHRKKPVIVSDIMTDPLWAPYTELTSQFGLASCWSTPILSPHGDLLGTFACYSKRKCVPSQTELEVAHVAARTAALIIDRKRSEDSVLAAKNEAESASASKSAFLANMSHEIRSPLGAIMGFADLLKSPSLSRDDQQHFVSVIDRNANHLLRLIDDILDLSKVEAGKMEIESIEFSLPSLMTDFSSLMNLKAREKGILFELKYLTPIPKMVNSDPTRIRQILNNVVGNAIKFTDRGRVQLLVSHQDHQLEFKVVDTGRGITPGQASRLFKPFQQADVSTTRQFGGTGLGLVLTRRLAHLMGGDFQLERSVPLQGSVFVATLQVAPASVASTARFESAHSLSAMLSQPGEPLKDLRVLVIEDSEDNQVLFRLVLNKLGAKVEIGTDGYEGVNMALTADYDAILCDIQMPRMDGYAVIRELRERGYAKPIFALTAHAMKEERDRAVEAGFTGFLTKPVNRDSLVDALSDCVRGEVN